MGRRRGTHDGQTNSIECFLDVVCNLIGVLLLMAIISALVVKEKVYDVFTPMEQSAGKSAHYLFAVTSEGIYPFEKNQAFKKLRSKNTSRTLAVETRYFHYTADRSRITCRMKGRSPGITGENIPSILNELRRLRKSNEEDDSYFVYFVVSPDEKAFRLFRLARRELLKNKIRVGWSPIDPEKTVSFVNCGIKILPQG